MNTKKNNSAARGPVRDAEEAPQAKPVVPCVVHHHVVDVLVEVPTVRVVIPSGRVMSPMHMQFRLSRKARLGLAAIRSGLEASGAIGSTVTHGMALNHLLAMFAGEDDAN